MGPGKHGDAFLFGGQGHGMDLRIFERTIDEHRMPGVGHIRKLRDVPGTQNTVDFIRPLQRLRHNHGSFRFDSSYFARCTTVTSYNGTLKQSSILLSSMFWRWYDFRMPWSTAAIQGMTYHSASFFLEPGASARYASHPVTCG